MCSGYYDYEAGYLPEFAGMDRFKGRIVHPQKWTDDIDYAGKRVVVIGSGAHGGDAGAGDGRQTAAHVTMLQRSPTYMVARPGRGSARQQAAPPPAAQARLLDDALEERRCSACISTRCASASRTKVKSLLLGGVRQMLGPDYDVDTHFTPRYNPWDQRLCLVPDADFFRAIRRGKVSVVTDQIETFTETGIRLQIRRRACGRPDRDARPGWCWCRSASAKLSVDGRAVDPAKTFIYKGMMYSDVPNLASAFGYTNASWTLKADLVCEYVCRLLNHMDRGGYRQCTPRTRAIPPLTEEPWVDFSSGYIQRALAKQPKQGSKRPWKLYQNYALDLLSLRFGSVRDTGDGAGAAGQGEAGRRPRRRSGQDLHLQGHDVLGRAQSRLGVRLHQRLMEAFRQFEAGMQRGDGVGDLLHSVGLCARRQVGAELGLVLDLGIGLASLACTTVTGDGFTNGRTRDRRSAEVRAQRLLHLLLHGGDLPAGDRPAQFLGDQRGHAVGSLLVGQHQARVEAALLATVASQRSPEASRGPVARTGPWVLLYLCHKGQEAAMRTQAEKGQIFRELHAAAGIPAPAQPVGCRHRQAAAVAGLRGAGDDQPRHVQRAGPRRRRRTR